MDSCAKKMDFSSIADRKTLMPRRAIAAEDRAVPIFFLYGEPRRQVSPRFLHLEFLEQRSRPTNWRIRPHAHAELHHLFLVAEGAGRMDADGVAIDFTAPCLLTIPARSVHGFAWQRETRGRVLTLADSYLRDLLAREPAFCALFATPACLPGADPKQLDGVLDGLQRELAWSAPGHDAAVEANLLLVMVEALRLQQHAVRRSQPKPGRAADLVARFRERVELAYRSGAGVEDHAAALGVTPAMLRRACSRVAGVSPLQIIQERCFLEAQRVLLYTNMSVAQAASHLGFTDAAYFSRYFVRHAGVSPGRFRSARRGR
jgi:AraC family transcriptional activator of pobA